MKSKKLKIKGGFLSTDPIDISDVEKLTKVPDKPVLLFNDSLPRLLIAQSGLLSSGGKSFDHRITFNAESTSYDLDSGADSLDVNLTYQDPTGLSLLKTYTFYRDRYVVDMKVTVNNTSAEDWSGRLYRQFQSTQVSDGQTFIYTYTGGVVSTPKKRYEKVGFKESGRYRDFLYVEGAYHDSILMDILKNEYLELVSKNPDWPRISSK